MKSAWRYMAVGAFLVWLGPEQVQARAIVTNAPVLFSDQPDAGEARIYLPVLEDGPGEGCFIFYREKLFDLFVDKNGRTTFKLKDDSGEYVGQELSPVGDIAASWSKPVLYKYRSDKSRYIVHRGVRRSMVEISPPVTPTDTPSGKIVIEAMLMDNVRYKRTYKFKGDTVEIMSGIRGRHKYYPSHSAYGLAVKSCMDFAPHVEIPDRTEALKGYELVMHGEERKEKQTFYFSENKKLMSRLKMIDLAGPWGPRHWIMETENPSMNFHMYRGNCPYQGFNISIVGMNRESMKTSKQAKVTITIK